MAIPQVQTTTPQPIPAQVDCALDRLVERITVLGMSAPALFLLEAHLPLTTIVHTAGLAAEPLVSPMFGAERIEVFKLIYSERRYLEELIRRIEIRLPKKQKTRKDRAILGTPPGEER